MTEASTDRGIMAAQDPLVDRAVRLFEFLGRAQQLRNQPTRDIDSYEKVLWFKDLPDHPALYTAFRQAEPAPEDPLLTMLRVPRVDPPVPVDELGDWIDGRLDEPDTVPILRESISVHEVPHIDASALPTTDTVAIEQRPLIKKSFEHWIEDWHAWAKRERLDRDARKFYGDLFSTYVTAAGHPEELELVVGVGCLAWTPAGHPAVRRHLVTAPVSLRFDDDTGELIVTPTESEGSNSVEIDMLDPGLITNPQNINLVREHARDLFAHPLNRSESGGLVRRIVHTLSPDAEYRDEDEIGASGSRPIAAFAPAIILRKRSQRGIVEIFQTIVDQLKSIRVVPDGVLPLIDPDHLPSLDAAPAQSEHGDGALVLIDNDPFLPLPLNDVQLRILRQVDSHAQTLVQGPPGTGKTHTAAALISHLLAQGKRVLVTAHTDRALREVRDKLPEAIRPLAVAVVGTTREDMSDLRVAVERIAARAAERDSGDAEPAVTQTLTRIDELRRLRAAVYRSLLAAREHEVQVHEFGGYRGTLAEIAQQLEVDSTRFGWIEDFVERMSGPTPLGNSEVKELHAHLTDGGLLADEADAQLRLIDLAALPNVRAFADLLLGEENAARDDARHTPLKNIPAFGLVRRLEPAARRELSTRLYQLAGEMDYLSRRPEVWMREALSDVRNGRIGIWEARRQQLSQLVATVAPLVRQLGSIADVTVDEAEIGRLVPFATALNQYLATGGRIKLGADGLPKMGPFTDRIVKQAQPFFDAVRVDGATPATQAQVGIFLTWAEGLRTLSAMDRSWPAYVAIPPEDTLHERLHWHVTELAQLSRVLGLAGELGREEDRMRRLRLPFPDWNDSSGIRNYAQLANAAAGADALAAAREPLDRLQHQIAGETRLPGFSPPVVELLNAVRNRQNEGYASARARLQRLTDVRRALLRRDEFRARLTAGAPLLHAAITDTAQDVRWVNRLDSFADAWNWGAAANLVREQKALDVNALQAQVIMLEEEIREHVEILAAARAWNHAVGPDRLSRSARASLEQYAYLVRKLGKGTGKYQAVRKAEIRQAMDRCRPAVPVWVLPIYRIADQLRINPDMFDVVIVDEASQAGLEATFLQYMAPRIVVIGDDKQVSPSAVGVDQQQLRDLAAQYLHDDPYRPTWQDPQRSLFDEAKMRFSGMLTLVEHRRCMPEIIGFSNRIAYEPDGVRLIPVRQYGANRLEPIKTVFLSEGYVRGSTGKINPVECEAIVDQVVACLADPRYDGLTMGVISLLGPAQAKFIEQALLGVVSPEDWTARDLRCGDAAAFQGSERNVMFLSMVAAPEPGRRLAALTADLYMQRYNVAASRAKDQMWLFHSISLNDLGNPQDMRFKLLDYCYGVRRRSESDDDRVLVSPLPEDVIVKPFDSLFEQRVCNKLLDAGYTVIPQYPEQGYRIDLVVVGAKAKLAIECDGDHWHGPAEYQRDMARQRDLERCGWNFFRVRESEFYIDKAFALEGLWGALTKLAIHPSGWSPVQDNLPATPDLGRGQEYASESADFEGAEVPEPVHHALAGSTYTQRSDQRGLQPDPEQVVAIEPRSASSDRQPDVYQAFTGVVPSLTTASRDDIVRGLVAITATEGPIIGHRLQSVYCKASGGQRLGPQLAKVLNAAVAAAVRQGQIVQDDPLREGGVKPTTFRLPGQSVINIRPLGPRNLDQVPPGEIAEVMRDVGQRVGWNDEERLHRATLAAYDLTRLTPNVIDRLRAVAPLARIEDSEDIL